MAGMASQRIASQSGMHREFLVTSQVTQIEMECGGFIHKSCSSIRQSEVPQSSTDATGTILKINVAIAEDMHQNLVPFHAANGILNKDPSYRSAERKEHYERWDHQPKPFSHADK